MQNCAVSAYQFFRRIFLYALLCAAVLIFYACAADTPAQTSAAPAAEAGLSLDRAYIKISYSATTSVTASYQVIPESKLHFFVEDASIVQAAQRGYSCNLTAVGFGKTTLFVTYGNDTVSVPVEVAFEKNKLQLVHEATQSAGNATFPALLDQSLDLKTVLKYGTTELDDAVLSYAVEDETIGSIDQSTGVFTPIQEGTTEVTVTAIWDLAAEERFTASYTVNVSKHIEDSLTDFVVDIAPNKDIVILQLTDTQIIDPGQSRYPERINNTKSLTDADLESKCFAYIRRAVQKSKPDLIIITGDIVYGEFDDSGVILEKFVAFMESLNIPWAPVFGNHDNESTKGVSWQCQQFLDAPNCLFRRGHITGNSNYTIGIRQNNRLVKVVYMMDSNGCARGYNYSYLPSFPAYNQGESIKTSIGFSADQLQWLTNTAQKIDSSLDYPVSKFLATHIPMAEFGLAASEAGYQAFPSDDKSYIIGETVTAQNGDFGQKREAISGLFVLDGLWEALKAYHFDGVFVGHDHRNSMSILYDGIRFSYGLKSSTFDYYSDVGATKITIASDGETFEVKHLYD